MISTCFGFLDDSFKKKKLILIVNEWQLSQIWREGRVVSVSCCFYLLVAIATNA